MESSARAAFSLNGIAVEPQSNRIGDARVDGKSMRVLLCLVDAAPEVVSTQALLDAVWGDVIVNDNVVHQALTHLRKALGDDTKQPTFIETIPRKGYKLIGAVSAQASVQERLVSSAEDSGGSAEERMRWRWLAGLGLMAVLLTIAVVQVGEPGKQLEITGSDVVRVMVLPFDELVNDDAGMPHARVLTNNIWQQLRDIEGIELIHMPTARQLHKSNLDIRVAAKQVQADFVLHGSVTAMAGNLRVDTNLFTAQSGVETWNQTFSRRLASTVDWLSLYDEIAGQVSGEFPIGAEARIPQVVEYVPSLAGYNVLQQVQYGSLRVSERIRLLQQLVIDEPQYADAYAHLAYWWSIEAELRRVVPREGMENAKHAAQQALKLDAENALAHSVMGAVHAVLELDFPQALDAYARAEAFGIVPDLNVWKQDTLVEMGMFEQGLAFTRSMQAVNPLAQELKVYTARMLWGLGRREEAARLMCEGALTGESLDFGIGNGIVFFVHYARDYERAEELMARARGLDRLVDRHRAYIAHRRGDSSLLQALVERGDSADSEYADELFYVPATYELGDYPSHFSWMRRRVENRNQVGQFYTFLRINPEYWDVLEQWAAAPGRDQALRRAQLEAHQALLKVATKNMLPVDKLLPWQ